MARTTRFRVSMTIIIALLAQILLISAVPSTALAATSTTALRAAHFGIDCHGQTSTPYSTHGTVSLTRTGATTAELRVSLTQGDPHTTYSIEVFEAVDSGCYPDDLGDTGVRITTDGSGDGQALVVLTLPYPSLGGATFGDGLGEEALVVVLDRHLSQTASGDAFVSERPLPLLPEEQSGPEASFTWQRDAKWPLRIHFDASRSTGDGLVYKWTILNLPPDVPDVFIRNEPFFTFDFPATGRYFVALEVTDAEGRTAAAVQPISVLDLRLAYDTTDLNGVVDVKLSNPKNTCSDKTSLTLTANRSYWTSIEWTGDPAVLATLKADDPLTAAGLIPPKGVGARASYSSFCFTDLSQSITGYIHTEGQAAVLLNFTDFFLSMLGGDLKKIFGPELHAGNTTGFVQWVNELSATAETMPHFKAMQELCFSQLLQGDQVGAFDCFNIHLSGFLQSPDEVQKLTRLLLLTGKMAAKVYSDILVLGELYAALDAALQAGDVAKTIELASKIVMQTAKIAGSTIAKWAQIVIKAADQIGDHVLGRSAGFLRVYAIPAR
jgi:hypothetical protein